jgi:hypothetical protein
MSSTSAGSPSGRAWPSLRSALRRSAIEDSTGNSSSMRSRRRSIDTAEPAWRGSSRRRNSISASNCTRSAASRLRGACARPRSRICRHHCAASSIQLPMRARSIGRTEAGNSSEANSTATTVPRMISSLRATTVSKMVSGEVTAGKPMKAVV